MGTSLALRGCGSTTLPGEATKRLRLSIFFLSLPKWILQAFLFAFILLHFPLLPASAYQKVFVDFEKIFKLHSDIQLTCLALIRCGRSAFSQWKSTIFQPFTCRTWGTQVTRTDSDRIQGASYRTWSVEVRDLQLSLGSFFHVFPILHIP